MFNLEGRNYRFHKDVSSILRDVLGLDHYNEAFIPRNTPHFIGAYTIVIMRYLSSLSVSCLHLLLLLFMFRVPNSFNHSKVTEDWMRVLWTVSTFIEIIVVRASKVKSIPVIKCCKLAPVKFMPWSFGSLVDVYQNTSRKTNYNTCNCIQLTW